METGERFELDDKSCVVDEVEGDQALTCVDDMGNVEVMDADEVDMDRIE
jgi:hypothetical protein